MRSFHLYHPRIVHLCNVKEVAPSKRLNSKALIYLFYLFLSWFRNSDPETLTQRLTQGHKSHAEPTRRLREESEIYSGIRFSEAKSWDVRPGGKNQIS